MRLDSNDTIAAIATPLGPAPRGIVRLSGPEAWPLALADFKATDGRNALLPRAGLRWGSLRVQGIRPSLPAAVALWPGPLTYTAQAMAEIHTVGTPAVLRALLADLNARGARLAEPGEFTLRAFLAGRIDLTRAEAVLAVIDAGTPAQLDAALRQLAGGLAGSIGALRDRLLDVLAHVEANLDFADEPDVDPVVRGDLAARLDAAGVEVAELACRLTARDRAEGLPRVVLSGPPNTGKSRLFNALLGDARAIVSHVAGTTRDYLAAPCDCAGRFIELIDTAGFEIPGDAPIGDSAQARRAEQLGAADLVLACRSADARGDDPAVLGPSLRVWTKCDLVPAIGPDWLPTSAATGVGIERLKGAIAERLGDHRREADTPSLTSARCREGLTRAAAALADAASTLALGGDDELVALNLRNVLDELGQVVGAVATDDLLDRIFGRFCIGK
jgi:tRNA modification GTPase